MLEFTHRSSRRQFRRLLLLVLAALPAAAPIEASSLVGSGGLCLGSAGDQPAAGAAVVLKDCGNGADQRWRLPSAGFSGEVGLGEGLCLDAPASNTGTGLRLATCNSSTSRQWRLPSDGRLRGPGGLCADPNFGPHQAEIPMMLLPCDDGEQQIFQAIGENQWHAAPVSRHHLQGNQLFGSDDSQILYIVRVQLHRSDDGGRTFGAVKSELPWPYHRVLQVVDRSDPDRLFASQEGDLYRSLDGGRSWVPVFVGPGQQLLWVAQSSVDPAVFTLVNDTGLWRSRDRGATFEPLSTLPAPGNISASLAFAANGDLYLSRHQGCPQAGPCGAEGQLFRSTDQGATWALVRSSTFAYRSHVVIGHPTDGATVYWIHHSGSGEYQNAVERTEDAGATWETSPVVANLPDRAFVSASAPDDLWLAEDLSFLHSRDRGRTWQRFDFGEGSWVYSATLAMAGGVPVAVVNRELQGSQLLRWDGSNWGDASEVDLLVLTYQAVAAPSRAGRLYGYGDDIWRSDDFGRTRVILSEHGYCLGSLAVAPDNADVLYGSGQCHNLGKIFRSLDAGATLTPAGPQLGSLEYPMDVVTAQRPNGPGHVVLVPLNDHGASNVTPILRSDDQFATWSRVELPGLLGHLWSEGATFFARSQTQGDTYFVSTDGGLTWTTRVAPGEVPYGGTTSPLVANAGEGRLRYSVDRGATWRDLPAPKFWGPTVRAWSDRGRIVLEDANDQLVMSADLGQSWHTLVRDLPAGGVDEVIFDPHDPLRLATTTLGGLQVGRFDLGHPYVTKDPSLGLGQRFDLRLRWRDAAGQEGAGYPIRLTDDTGLFWLFTADRAEVAVKVLDARAINGRFWVFVGSLTNVEFDLEVLDRLTGESRSYHNPLHNFSSFGDTAAFPIGEATLAVVPPAAPVLAEVEASASVRVAERFEVSVEWQDFAGNSGSGQGFALTRETGGFYFFDPNNVELLVNIADGRELNGHFWVFLASLSNVEYTVTIRDTVSGAVKTYHNPAGTFASVGDTSAF